MDIVEYKTLHKPGQKSGKELLELQYRNGLAVVERNPWAKSAYQQLLARCPHLSEEELIRLFHNRSQSQLEIVVGAALFRQYNAVHPPKSSIRAGFKIKPVRRVGLVTFEAPPETRITTIPARKPAPRKVAVPVPKAHRPTRRPPARKATKTRAKPKKAKSAPRRAKPARKSKR
jgi:hypothetical protein